MQKELEFDFSFQPSPIVKPFSKGSTVYSVTVILDKKSWQMSTAHNFLGKKFLTPEEAKEVGMKFDPKHLYGKGTVKTAVVVNEIEKYLTHECVVTPSVFRL